MPSAEDGHHHHARAGAEVAAVHPGQRGEERRHRRHRARAARAGVALVAVPRSQRVIRGWTPTSRQVKRISHGTTASKTVGRQGEQQHRADDGPDGAGDEHDRGDRAGARAARRGSRTTRSAPAGVSPTVLEALATTGGRPTATSTGKLSSDATPTVEVRMPGAEAGQRGRRAARAVVTWALAEQGDVADHLDVGVHRAAPRPRGRRRGSRRRSRGARPASRAGGRAGRATRSGSP